MKKYFKLIILTIVFMTLIFSGVVYAEEQRNAKGYVPFEIDLSHLAKNPPKKSSKLDKAATLPESYDLRAGNFVTSVKNQNPHGTCWAFATIGAMESNYLKQGNSNLDLSEMHLAWFTYKNADKSKAFGNVTKSTVQAVLNQGGNVYKGASIYTRLDGPVSETSLAYPDKPSETTPEAYKRTLRLKDYKIFSYTDRESIKEHIMQNGAVVASYCDEDDYFDEDNNSYYLDDDDINHSVLLVGWDDNFSKENFKNQPSINGAWLVKNSWSANWGDNGYFWLSYEQKMADCTSITVEELNEYLKCYYYDALGWVGYLSGPDYEANIFKSSRNNEQLKEIGFYTPDNNMTCEISVYTGISTITSYPNTGTLALTQSVTLPYSGYHAISLDEAVALTKGEYFSVIVKFPSGSQIPVEMKVSGTSNNVKIESGSFFSSGGNSWVTGEKAFKGGVNACVKAFTLSDEIDKAATSKPTITTTSFKTGIVGEEYSDTLEIEDSGTVMLKFSGVPSGLTMNDTVLSGTPKKAGKFNITVKATNSIGTTTAKIPVTILAKPTITTKSLKSAKTDKKYSAKLASKGTLPIYWTVEGLPESLSVEQNADKGTATITGTPTEMGTYNLVITVSNDIGTYSQDFTLKIDGVAPKLSFKLPKGKVGEEYTLSKITATGTKPIEFACAIKPTTDLKKSGLSNDITLEDLGFTFTSNPDEGTAEITGKSDISFKNIAVVITVSNDASKAPKSTTAKFTVAGNKPVFVSPTETSYEYSMGEDVEIDFEVTGSDYITFSVSGHKDFTIEQTGDKTATVSGTVPTSSKAKKITLKVKATNADGSATKTITIQPISETDEAEALSESESSSEKSNSEMLDTAQPIHDELEESEFESENSNVKIIRERDISSLSNEFIKKISDEGLTIAAILPEISIEEDNTYEFTVSIDENISVNSKLIWRSQSEINSNDESELIAFYDVEDSARENAIEFVPENRKIIVEVWLKAGKYSPVILVAK